MKYILFPGCTVLAKDPGFEASAARIFEILGVEFENEPNFHCCAPTIVSSVQVNTAYALAARNLCLAEEKNLDIITLCSGCFKNLKKVNAHLKEDEEDRIAINDILNEIGKEFKGTIEVKHFVQVLYEDIGLEKIKENVKRPLSDMVFATFYGCHLIRPHEVVKFDDPEFPRSMDEIVEALGAKTVEYDGKYTCCGAGLQGVNDTATLEIPRQKLIALKTLDLDGLVLACPTCYFTFDLGQFDIQRKYKEQYQVAPLHLTEVLGIAFGLELKSIGMNLHRIKPKKIMAKMKA
ncbi:MAG: CoB--CoM heterodisulfide reductase subunit B [Candidatus Helarchaeota archaeon]|nr:CoB--CoM heterodisulfide reductase subunit B [Candidatus Helarchaeota archaeon]